MKEKYIKYHKDGSLYAKGFLEDGNMEGYWEWFRKDRSKMRSGYFKKDEQVGIWTTYDTKGNIVKETNFDKKKSKKK